jgi:hypothetical protein
MSKVRYAETVQLRQLSMALRNLTEQIYNHHDGMMLSLNAARALDQALRQSYAASDAFMRFSLENTFETEPEPTP